MSVTGAIIAGVSAAGSLGGAAIASSGGQKAASTAANADLQAAQLQNQLGEDQLNFEKSVYGNQQSELAPFLNIGYSGLANLGYLAGILPMSTSGRGAIDRVPIQPGMQPAAPQMASNPGADFGPRGRAQLDGNGYWGGEDTFSADPSLLNWASGGSTAGAVPNAAGSPAASGINVPSNLSSLINPNLGGFGSLLQPFQAPDSVTEQNDPGYQFRLQQGEQQLENSAAARGGLLSGGTEKALQDWAQSDASNEYSNVYNRAYNTFETNQSNTWNRLAALAGIGQTSTAQLGQVGNSALSTTANTTANIGAQVGNSLTAAGGARASGYANSGNIFGNAAGGIGGSISNLALLNWLYPGGSGGGGTGAGFTGGDPIFG